MKQVEAVESVEIPFSGLVPGRIVHYWPLLHEARHNAGPWAAIVVKVDKGGEPALTTGVVSLAVFPPAPRMVGTDPVSRVDGVVYFEGGAEGCWSWPPK